MVGIYGTIGTSNEFDQVKEHFFFTGDESPTLYKDKESSIYAIFHDKKEAKSQPVEHDDINIFIWGEICGHGDLKKYTSRKELERKFTDAEYCRILYDKFGLNFIHKLNSNFAGVIVDNKNSKTHLFTDRLGSRPLYYTKSSEDSLIFSTSIQAVARHSDYDIKFVKKFLCQYLTTYRVLGLYTPLKNIRKIHPGSIFTFNHKTGKINKRIYWKPQYKPLNKNFQFFVNWFTKIFDDVMYDRLDENKEQGLLLSGGTDSRLIANYLKNQKFFHINERMNREALIAKKVSTATDNEFHFLKREIDYIPKSLKKVAPIMNFISPFIQAWAIGFSNELNEVDTIIHGTRADVMLQGYVLPLRYIPFSKIPLKLEKKNIYNYIEHIENDNPKYINFDFRLKNSVSIDRQLNQINGIKYGDLKNIIQYGKIYPFSNLKNLLNVEQFNQINKSYSPFEDNRILEFTQYFPSKYQIRKNVVKQSLNKKNRKLSKMIHPDSLQSSYRTELIHDIFQFIHSNLDLVKHHMKDQGPWPNYSKIMRRTGYAEKSITQNKEIFNEFDYLDYNNALSMVKKDSEYRHIHQIHIILSFLEIYNNITR